MLKTIEYRDFNEMSIEELKAEFKLVATGTPVENSLADFWCLMDTACPEYLGGYQEFRSKFITPIILC